MSEAIELKEKGNDYYKNGQYEEAIGAYTQALNVEDIPEDEKLACLKNRAACHLKQKEYLFAVADASEALTLSPQDTKALFRRCQGYEGVNEIEKAYSDATKLLKMDPKNTAVQKMMQRISPLMQQTVQNQTSTDGKVKQMFSLAFEDNPDITRDKKLGATNNIMVLAREDAGAEKIVRENGIYFLNKMTQVKDDVELKQSAIRALSNLADNSRKRTESILRDVGIHQICDMIGSPEEQICVATSSLLCNIINSMTDVEAYKAKVKEHAEKKKRKERCRPVTFEMDENGKNFIDQLFTILTKMLPSWKVSAYGRDNIMEIFIKYLTRSNGVGWSKRFMEIEGMNYVLNIAGSHRQLESVFKVTENSRMHAALLMSKIYDDMISDKEREIFKEHCHNYFKEQFGERDLNATIEAVRTITTLLQGPFEVGLLILGMEGVIGVLVSMAKSDNRLHQMTAVEALVCSASNKDKCTGVLKDAVPVLDALYDCTDPHVRVRALVGLCKMASFKGTDYSIKTLDEGENLILAEDCIKYLTNPNRDKDLWKWATEGLAYLTLDADIKELIMLDREAIKSIIEVAKNPSDKITTYAAITVFVNLTNSYDKQDVPEEIKELAKFSKQHVPEDHPKDSYEYAKKRVRVLAEEGMVAALVELSKTESENSREQITRIFIALSTEEDLRGLIVQGGGAKALCSLFADNSEVGKTCAAHSLAKIAVTMNPDIAFPGQRMYEIVRPLVHLLHIDRTGLQNFEALMGLTNLASVGDSVRKRIISENGFCDIEHYMYEDHEMIRRAATECMCNLVMCEDALKLFEKENDRVKMLLLYSADEDVPTAKAAAGALAILSSSLIVCQKIVTVNSWVDLLLALTVNESLEMQHRGIYILMNMIGADKEIAAKIVEGQLLEVMMAVSRFEDPEKKTIQECAEAALQKLTEYELIKPT